MAVLSTSEPGSLAVADCAAERVGGRALGLAADVADPQALDAVVASVERGLGPVDVLVNDAGIALRRPVGRCSDADWDRVLAVNLSGPFYLARRCVPGMAERRWGRVINVSSISSRVGTPGMTAYCASKWGLNGFTQALAAEVKERNVLVAAVLPGSVDTDMLKGSGWEPEMTPDRGGAGGDLPLCGGSAGDEREPGGDVRMNRPGKEQLEACRCGPGGGARSLAP